MPSQITDVFYAISVRDTVISSVSAENRKQGYRSPFTSSVSNYDRYLHSLLKEIGEEFNDTVITEVKVGGVVNRSEKMLRSQICQDIRTVHFL